jgi:hypothetical protein
MALPKLYTEAEVSEILGLSIDTLQRYRANGTGIQWLKVGDGGNIRYTEDAIAAYLKSCEQNQTPDSPPSPSQARAAVLTGLKEVGEAHRARVKEMQNLDREDTTEANPYAVTMTRVGETPGSQIQHINLVPPTDVIAPASPHILTSR